MRHSRGVADTLTAVAGLWPTPMAGTPAQNGNAAAGSSDFSRRAESLAADLWMTPDVPNGGRALPKGTTATGKRPDGTKAQVGLSNQVSMWTTPQAHDVTPRGSGQKPGSAAGNACLARDAMTWPTPAARDTRSEEASPDFQRDRWDHPRGKPLTEVARVFSRPALPTMTHGPTRCDPRLIWRRLRRLVISTHGRAVWKRMAANGGKRRLNPNFVAWLMGWPIGHPSCVCSATEFALWQRRMRGALSQMPMALGPWIWMPPVKVEVAMQGDLFGGST
jgi:hypothetical protein